jgi:hypothetical protein
MLENAGAVQADPQSALKIEESLTGWPSARLAGTGFHEESFRDALGFFRALLLAVVAGIGPVHLAALKEREIVVALKVKASNTAPSQIRSFGLNIRSIAIQCGYQPRQRAIQCSYPYWN